MHGKGRYRAVQAATFQHRALPIAFSGRCRQAFRHLLLSAQSCIFVSQLNDLLENERLFAVKRSTGEPDTKASVPHLGKAHYLFISLAQRIVKQLQPANRPRGCRHLCNRLSKPFSFACASAGAQAIGARAESHQPLAPAFRFLPPRSTRQLTPLAPPRKSPHT
jgi:hypothetical protein